MDHKINRRRFLVLGCSTLCTAALGSGCTSKETQDTTTCPYGEVNDKYPGKCRRYIDKNRDGICDLSESS